MFCERKYAPARLIEMIYVVRVCFSFFFPSRDRGALYSIRDEMCVAQIRYFDSTYDLALDACML